MMIAFMGEYPRRKTPGHCLTGLEETLKSPRSPHASNYLQPQSEPDS